MVKHQKLLKKTTEAVLFTAVTASCGSVPDPFTKMTIVTPQAPSSVIVCRSKQCAPARSNMTREFLYNALLNLFDNNLDTSVLFCEADPATHACYENYLQFQMKAGVTPATAVIDSAKIQDVRINEKDQLINVAFSYNLHYNAIRPVCRTSENSLFVKSADYVLLEDTGFRCKFTTVATSMLSTVFAFDYVNLDYGEIGAHYSIGVSGPAYGGGTGYVLMRFQKTAFPSDPKKFVLPKPEVAAPPVVKKGDTRTEYGVKTDTNSLKLEPGQYKVRPLPMK